MTTAQLPLHVYLYSELAEILITFEHKKNGTFHSLSPLIHIHTHSLIYAHSLCLTPTPSLSLSQSKDKMKKGSRRATIQLKGAIIGIDDEDDCTFTIRDQTRIFHFQGQSSNHH